MSHRISRVNFGPSQVSGSKKKFYQKGRVKISYQKGRVNLFPGNKFFKIDPIKKFLGRLSVDKRKIKKKLKNICIYEYYM